MYEFQNNFGNYGDVTDRQAQEPRPPSMPVRAHAGYEEVRLVDTTEEIFGSKSRAKMLALGASAALVGRK